MGGENNDFEAHISQLELRESALNQQVEELKNRVEELVKQKEYLEKQLEQEDKKRQDITPFCDQTCKIQEQMHHSQVSLTNEIYKARLIMGRMKVITAESLDFRKRLLEVEEKFKSKMTWRESNSMFPDHLPHKTTENIKSEMALLDFCRKASRKISNEIPKTVEKCQDFYKKSINSMRSAKFLWFRI